MNKAITYITENHADPLDVNQLEVLFQDYGVIEIGNKQDSREFLFNFINIHFPDLRALMELEFSQYLTCTVCQNLTC